LAKVVIGRVRAGEGGTRAGAAGASQPKKARLTRTRAVRGMRCERADGEAAKENVTTAAANAQESTFTSAQERPGLPWLIIRGPRHAELYSFERMKSHPMLARAPAFRCPHACADPSPSRSRSGRLFSLAGTTASLCSLSCESLACMPSRTMRGPLSRTQCPVSVIIRPRNAGRCTHCGVRLVRLWPAIASLRVHNLREPCRPFIFACSCLTLYNFRVTAPLSTQMPGYLQSVHQVALRVVNVCTRHRPVIRSQATEGQRPKLRVVLRPVCGEQITHRAKQLWVRAR
jgi:hypothetical protein